MDYEIIEYKEDNIKLDVYVSPYDNTVWLSLNELVKLFKKDKSVISRHIKNILQQFPDIYASDVAKIATTGLDGKAYNITHYSLQIITLLSYRVKSQHGLSFKKWAEDSLNNLRNKKNINYEIVRFNRDNLILDVKVSPSEDTVWLTQNQIAALFESSIPNISYHIKNIYETKELDEEATIKYFLIVQNESGRDVSRNIAYYNLDMIISIGYRVNTQNGISFRKWANTILKEYLLKGYVIDKDRTFVTNDNYLNLVNKVTSLDNKVDNIDNRVTNIEDTLNNKIINEKVFFNGQFFDAFSFISDLINNANTDIILIDNYCDIKALNYLVKKKDNVKVIIYKSSKAKLTNEDIEIFNKQYHNLEVHNLNTFHDRFLILDNKEIYHLGTSLNYAGNKTFAITKIEDEKIKRLLIDAVLIKAF